MRSTTIGALALAAGNVVAQRPECVDGLYMIVARGTGEDVGAGESGKVTSRIEDQIPNSKTFGIDYPASFNGEVGDNNYFESVEAGYDAMKAAINAYYNACPDGKMAIFGYSQGAQISGDALCGGSGGWFNDGAKPVDIDIVRTSIVSIVLFGDPTYLRDATYSRGTGDEDGIFEREDESAKVCSEMSERMVSYCDKGDVFCGPELFNIDKEIHGQYVVNYGDEVVDLVVNAYENFEPDWHSGVNGLANQLDDVEEAAVYRSPPVIFASLMVVGLCGLLL